jgi:hypothetical protein
MYRINDEILTPTFYLTNKANVHHVLYIPLFGMIICKAFVTLVLLGLEFFFKPIYLYPIDFYFLFF